LLLSFLAVTDEEFREQIEARGHEFRNIVYCFGLEEGAYTLSRWLLARKFIYEDGITMAR
jgi:hypothetical protein